ncbi:LLM class F420-dependent oxidoreductase [Microbacterium pseudoresistens]|uniref:5,10-methylenetetrahydromethanopterin reductase n=1 Tax=Microbacterium pseudoresistens TaxID=640634 RepID=A0A7Y9EVB5_9MICO|nr:LLM class flavin-dependent oxidoreductase [Microbacterium pseudoresistens]NYD54629.1 5,10-methylenetetrahydromethanopterin reductase [Microbacterium pseudoresistens]
MALPALSIHLSNHGDAARTVEDIVLAESRGVRRVWVSEDLFHRGAMPIVAAALARTRTIELAFGVLAPQHRHPASMAMDIRSLREIGGDRIIIGLGSGVAERGALIAQPASPPLRIVDEAVSALRTLLAGSALDQEGVLHTSKGLRLTGASAIPPVYVAAVGPKALQQAGRRMDGVVLTMMCSQEHARWAAGRVAAAAVDAGRGQVPVVAYLPIAVDEDGAEARDRMRGVLGYFIARWSQVAFLSKLFLDWSELDVERMTRIREAFDAGEPLDELLPDALVDQYCVAGTAEECHRTIEAFAEAGITEIAFDASDDLDGVTALIAELQDGGA